MSDLKKYAQQEWLDKAIELFGEPDKVAFKCPVCGHVQTLGDFRSRGLDYQQAYFNCIGRYIGGRSAFHEEGPGPCDYTSGGLFCLNTVVVVKDGKEVPVFEFAFEEEAA
jgi:predicted RNA-binding Zn-ribbon protein involved in translation (DUF1610 family)